MAKTPKKHLVLLALASLAVCLPVFLLDMGGDILFHYTLIECFSRGVWSGNLYPRWCFEADGSLGSPVFFFYFPFGYWMAALFYPLRWLGAFTNSVHAMACLAATLVTAYGCYRWLIRFAKPGAALIGSVVFLYVPYRMDVLLYRSAYAELWGMALLPFVMAAFYDAARGNKAAWSRLTICLALLLLAHGPLTFVVLVAGGFYLLRAGDMSLKEKFWRYAGVGLMVFTLTAFYAVPAFYYRQYAYPLNEEYIGAFWPNTYLSLKNFREGEQQRLAVALWLMIAATLGAALYTYAKRQALPREICRDAGAWGIILAVALFMLFPISAPVWWLFKPIEFIALPWRMLALIGLASAYFVAIYGSFLISDRKLKTARGDAAGFIGLLVLLSLFTMVMRDAEVEDLFRKVVDLQRITPQEYRTRWTEKEFYGDFVLSRKGGARTEIVDGSGVASIKRWKDGAIDLSVQAFSPVTLRIAHRYYPLWKASDNGRPIILRPEPNTGWMILQLAPGTHSLTLSFKTLTGNIVFFMATFASIIGWIAELMAWRRVAATQKAF